MIDVGYTDYEADIILERTSGRINLENEYSMQELGGIYRKYKSNKIKNYEDYFPFYFWILDYFDMYRWKPGLVKSKEEEDMLIKQYHEYKKSLSEKERDLIRIKYLNYRDETHNKGEFLYPAYYWCLKQRNSNK